MSAKNAKKYLADPLVQDIIVHSRATQTPGSWPDAVDAAHRAGDIQISRQAFVQATETSPDILTALDARLDSLLAHDLPRLKQEIAYALAWRTLETLRTAAPDDIPDVVDRLIRTGLLTKDIVAASADSVAAGEDTGQYGEAIDDLLSAIKDGHDSIC